MSEAPSEPRRTYADLAPCEKCGLEDGFVGELWKSRRKMRFHAYCLACEHEGPPACCTDSAIAAWNRRAAPAAQPADSAMEVLRDALPLLEQYRSMRGDIACGRSNTRDVIFRARALVAKETPHVR